MDAPLSINLRAAMAEHGFTQEGLARHIDVSQRTVQTWCAGEALPRWPQLVRLAKALDREPGWFYSTPDEKAAA